MANPKFNEPEPQKVEDLFLDIENPRIPEDKRNLSQDDLALYIAETYNALSVARSIALHQYFPSEPLIAIQSGKKLIVLEGNRRLSALKILRDSTLRSRLKNEKDWKALPTTNVPDEVPVLLVKNRRQVAPIIGYRHISGIQQWEPYAKARYIASQVGKGKITFKDAALDVGETEGEVRSNYRNYRIAEQIIDSGADKKEIDSLFGKFGVFSRAMQTKDLRDFIGAPDANEVSISKDPIPSSKKAALKELTGYMFGPRAVLKESRELNKLGAVIASEEGLKVLRKERNLETAYIASGGLRERLIIYLGTASKNLKAAKLDMSKYKKDDDVQELLKECRDALGVLESI